MAYTDDAVLAEDQAFQNRVRMSIVNTATAVASEPSTTKNHVDDKRSTLAKSVLNDPQSYVQRFTNAMIRAGSLTTTSTDANLDAAASAVWNGMAGVTSEDKGQ